MLESDVVSDELPSKMDICKTEQVDSPMASNTISNGVPAEQALHANGNGDASEEIKSEANKGENGLVEQDSKVKKESEASTTKCEDDEDDVPLALMKKSQVVIKVKRDADSDDDVPLPLLKKTKTLDPPTPTSATPVTPVRKKSEKRPNYFYVSLDDPPAPSPTKAEDLGSPRPKVVIEYAPKTKPRAVVAVRADPLCFICQGTDPEQGCMSYCGRSFHVECYSDYVKDPSCMDYQADPEEEEEEEEEEDEDEDTEDDEKKEEEKSIPTSESSASECSSSSSSLSFSPSPSPSSPSASFFTTTPSTPSLDNSTSTIPPDQIASSLPSSDPPASSLSVSSDTVSSSFFSSEPASTSVSLIPSSSSSTSASCSVSLPTPLTPSKTTSSSNGLTSPAPSPTTTTNPSDQRITPVPFCCYECANHQVRCFLCKVLSPVGGKQAPFKQNEVFKCSGSTCKKYYHRGCLAAYTEGEHLPKNLTDKEVVGTSHFETAPQFRCPMHSCGTCGELNTKTENRRQLYGCFKCPKTYHKQCIPPWEDFDILGTKNFLCSDHELLLTAGKTQEQVKVLAAQRELVSQAKQAALRKTQGATKQVQSKVFPSSFANALWTSPVIEVPFRIPQFVIALGNAWVPSEPPPYQKLSTNTYHESVGRPSAREMEFCQCSKEQICGEGECTNRSMNVECSKKCALGDRCSNQRFARKQWAKTKPVLTKDRGWGLFAQEDIPAGTFVVEYCGELISEDEKKRRLKEAKEKDEINFYYMQYSKDGCIDAGRKGSIARFANHSCAPNCVTQVWYVGYHEKVGIFALRDIPKGSEITYDYNFEYWEEGEVIECRCGAPNCSKSLGKKPQKKQAKLTKQEEKKKQKMLERRQKVREEKAAAAAVPVEPKKPSLRLGARLEQRQSLHVPTECPVKDETAVQTPAPKPSECQATEEVVLQTSSPKEPIERPVEDEATVQLLAPLSAESSVNEEAVVSPQVDECLGNEVSVPVASPNHTPE